MALEAKLQRQQLKGALERLEAVELAMLKHDLVLESIYEFFDKDERSMIEKLAKNKAAERGIQVED